MKHGGPDDQGIFSDEEHHLVLGNRRLSLIDLSHAGHQPMAFADRFEITFNGEIYNYLELKEELKNAGQSFSNGTDTEVILAAFAAWGTASFARLNGMFAFALWDRVDAKLYLVRDPSGIKPLYYASTREGLAFSSEVKGFRPIPYLQKENELWQIYLMAYGFLPEPVTTLEKVKPLEKGSFLCYDTQKKVGKIESYKKYRFTEEIQNREEAIHLIRETLQRSVNRNLIADAPVGIFLSGGIDSGIVALLANNSGKAINTLSVYFDNHFFSEKKYQDILLAKMECNHNQFLLKESEFNQNLSAVLQAMDQPSSDGINTWFISRYAKQNGLKAVLSGIGSDELFGGYPSFDRVQKVLFLEKLPKQLLETGKYTGLRKLRRMGYLSLGGTVGKYLFLRGQFIPSEIARYLNVDEEQVWRTLQQNPVFDDISDLSPYNQISWIEMNVYMQNQLLKDADTMSMIHGIEIRVPYLDQEFVELALRIKSSLKSTGAVHKQLLIDSFEDILPEPIWNRPKMGFSFPFKEWLTENEFAREIMDTNDAHYQRFLSGNLHWSQFLTALLIKNHEVEA